MSGGTDDSDFIGIRVANKHRAACVHKNAVWPGKLAFQRVALVAISAKSSAGDQMNGACYRINYSNRVILGIRDIDLSGRGNRNSLRPRERRRQRRSAVALETFFATA